MLENLGSARDPFRATIGLQAALVQAKLQTFQERLGGFALTAEINTAEASTLCYNLRLESRSNEALRLGQLNEVPKGSTKYEAGLVILAGDLYLNASKPGIAEVLTRAGFCDAAPTARLAAASARHPLEAGRHIDWHLFEALARQTQAQIAESL